MGQFSVEFLPLPGSVLSGNQQPCALCGQKGRRTADEYREASERKRAIRAGRERLMTMRQTIRNEALLSGDGGI